MLTGLVFGLLGFCFSGALDPDVWRRHADRFRRAIALSVHGISIGADWMEIDLGQLERQLSHDPRQHPSLKRMAKLPDQFWSWYALLLIVDYGIPVSPRVLHRAERMRRKLKKHDLRLLKAEVM